MGLGNFGFFKRDSSGEAAINRFSLFGKKEKAQTPEAKELKPPTFFEHAAMSEKSPTHKKGNGDHVFFGTGDNSGMFAVMDTANSDHGSIMETKKNMVGFLERKFRAYKTKLMSGNFEAKMAQLGELSRRNFVGQPGEFSFTMLGLFEEAASGTSEPVVHGKVAQWGDTAAFVFRKKDIHGRNNGSLEQVTKLYQSSMGPDGVSLSKKLGFTKDAEKSKPEIVDINNLKEGDVIILCSDGIHQTPKRFKYNATELLKDSESLSVEEIAKRLMQLGKVDDDKTVMVVRVKKSENTKPAQESEAISLTKTKSEITPTPEPNTEKKFFGIFNSVFETVAQKAKSIVARKSQSAKTALEKPDIQSIPGQLPASQPLAAKPDFDSQFDQSPSQHSPETDSLGNTADIGKNPEVSPAEVVVEPKAEAEMAQPEVKKQLWKEFSKKLKKVDWASHVLSGATGALVRVGAKVTMETMSFGAKTAVAAAAGAATSGVKEALLQRRARNEQLNQIFEKVYLAHNSLSDSENATVGSDRLKAVAELRDKREKGKNISAKELSRLLSLPSTTELNAPDEYYKREEDFKAKVYRDLEKARISKSKIAKAALKGAIAGAIGSMAVGEIIEFGSSHGWWSYLGEKANPAIGAALKALGLEKSQTLAVNAAPIKIESVAPPKIMKEVIKEKLYRFESPKIESLTGSARRMLHDYLLNENAISGKNVAGQMSVAQLVYAEDYVSKSLQAAGVVPGQKLEISGKLLAEALEKAKGLNPAQLEHLNAMLKTPDYNLGKAAEKFMTDFSETYTNKINSLKDLVAGSVNGQKVAEGLAMAH